MRFIKITAKNFKGLKLVEWAPSPGLNRVSGPNSAGKSSLLDAVLVLMLGERFAPARAIRDGELKAEITGDIGEYRVTRTWTRKTLDGEVTTRVVVETADGGVRKKPQELLDGLLSSVSIDPIAFYRLPASKQRDMLIEIAGLGKELGDLSAKHDAAYAARTDANREVTRLVAQRARFPEVIADVPLVDVAALTDQLREANKQNTAADTHASFIQRTTADAARIESEMDGLRARLKDLAAQSEKLVSQIAEAKAKPCDRVDTAPIEEQLRGAQQQNARHAEAQQARDCQKQLDEARKAAEAVDAKVEAIRASKVDLLSNAKWPIPEIGISDSEATWKGVPLSQAATNEQIRASVSLALSLKPTLRVIIVRNAAELTNDSMKAIENVVAESGYQALVECAVDDAEPGDGCIVLEEGEPWVGKEA